MATADETTTEAEPLDENYRQAMATLESTLGRLKGCSTAEREALRSELVGLEDMTRKLASGRVEIVVFGEISTGKSALINALLGKEVTSVNVQGGWTKEIGKVEWDRAGYSVPGLAQSQVILVDTPGLNEVGGGDRATMARETARYADLLLFVTDSDLNEIEYSAILTLASVHKPILLVLNKIDLYTKSENEKLLSILRDDRLKDVVPAENFVCTAADPRPVEYVVETASGRTESQWRKPSPNVDALKARILEVLEKDGLSLLALNAAMYAADNSDRVASLRIELRNSHANAAIAGYAAMKAIAVGLTPIPIFDVLGGAAADVALVVTLARIYGLNMSWVHARSLVVSIGQAAGWALLATTATHYAASMFKVLTVGWGTLLTALPQGAAAGYGAYIVGQAAKYYFEHGSSWGSESAKVVVQRILSQTDKDSVLRTLKEEIQKKLMANRHAKNG